MLDVRPVAVPPSLETPPSLTVLLLLKHLGPVITTPTTFLRIAECLRRLNRHHLSPTPSPKLIPPIASPLIYLRYIILDSVVLHRTLGLPFRVNFYITTIIPG
ncbi:hypothetical protein B0T12DRAFT_42503 [Alternaria alternata]|nr:hypothetical protein B0T12DRAFT_42503 [Alternaria alternata]